MISKRYYYYAGLIILALVLPACGQRNTTTTPAALEFVAPAVEPEVITGQAYVERIEILKFDTTPVQIVVAAMGDLPDTCTNIGSVTQRRDLDRSTLWVEIETVRAANDACQNKVSAFEERIPLDVYGLLAGTYAVNVNGATGMFWLAEDNLPLPLEGRAAVESVTVQASVTDPTRPLVIIEGVLPDACTQVSDVRQAVEAMSGEVRMEVVTSRPRDAACAAQLVAFAETVVLDTGGLRAGEYIVSVHGVTQTFALSVDSMVIAPTPTPSPTPMPTPTPAPTDAPGDGPPVAPVPPPLPTAIPDDNLVVQSVRLSSMDLRVTGTSPVRATVTARGVLPDTCSAPGPIEQRVDVDARAIWVTVNISHPRDAVCETASRSFEEQFELNITGLPAGTYTVDVNGITGSIVLGVGN